MIIPNPSEIVLDELEYVSTQFLPHERRLLDVFDSGIVSMIKKELRKRIDNGIAPHISSNPVMKGE